MSSDSVSFFKCPGEHVVHVYLLFTVILILRHLRNNSCRTLLDTRLRLRVLGWLGTGRLVERAFLSFFVSGIECIHVIRLQVLVRGRSLFLRVLGKYSSLFGVSTWSSMVVAEAYVFREELVYLFCALDARAGED